MNSPLLHIDPSEILRQLFVGAAVTGLRFGVLQLLFENPAMVSESYLNLASRWQVFPEKPLEFPELSGAISQEASEYELARAVTLRHKQVSAVEVLAPWPHLVMTFTDGTILLLNGMDTQHEPWTAGLAHAPPEQRTEVIACPGGELAFILPNHARKGSR